MLRDEKLTVPRVLAIAREIAAGLQAAHEAGVVHRDLKPANVMIEHDHAIIMDFGIARSTSRGASAPRPATDDGAALTPAVEDELTRVAATVVGEVIGTIEYMAPEQARGEHVDQRADIYAFGLIVYDMLVGKRRSEHAVSAVGELQKRLAQTPPPVRTRGSGGSRSARRARHQVRRARCREALSDDGRTGRGARPARR